MPAPDERRVRVNLSLAALGLVVASSLAWSGLDLSRKVLAGRITEIPLLFWLTALPLPLFLGWWLYDGVRPVPAAYWLPATATIALNIVANLSFMRSLRLSPLTATIPLLSLTPVFTSLVSIPLLNQRLGSRNWAGVALVVGGALLLNLRGGDAGSLAAFGRALRREPGVPFMAFTAFLWSITPPLDKLAMDRSTAPFHAFMLNAGVAVAMLALLIARRRLGDLRQGRGSAGPFAAAVVCAFLGLSTQLAAFSLIPVGLFETLKRGIGFVMAMLTGRLVLGEAITPAKLAAVGLMAVGVGLIVL
jgi:drug/metabolite transporter (DMT)-like permease